MKQFTFSEVSRLPGEMLDRATREPVMLTKHGKPKVVMLPADYYQRIMGASDTQALHLDDATADVLDDMLGGIEAYRKERPDNV